MSSVFLQNTFNDVVEEIIRRHNYSLSEAELRAVKNRCWIYLSRALQSWDPARAPLKSWIYASLRHHIKTMFEGTTSHPKLIRLDENLLVKTHREQGGTT